MSDKKAAITFIILMLIGFAIGGPIGATVAGLVAAFIVGIAAYSDEWRNVINGR